MQEYTHDLKVGDIIRAYHIGYHQITSIEKRYIKESDLKYSCYKDYEVGDEMAPLVHYKKLFNEFGVKAKNQKVNCCDITYCKKIDFDVILNQIKEYVNDYNDLFRYFNTGRIEQINVGV